MKKELLSELLHDKWYIQSGNLTPVYLMEAWMSGFGMQKDLGVSYSAGIFTSKNETGDLYYRVSDLERLHDFAFGEWYKDRRYFKKIRERYVKSQEPYTKLHEKVDGLHLIKVTDSKLYGYVKKVIEAITAAVGSGHIIEAIAIPSDERLKKELGSFVGDTRALNEVFVSLTTPETSSFAQNVYRKDWLWERGSAQCKLCAILDLLI